MDCQSLSQNCIQCLQTNSSLVCGWCATTGSCFPVSNLSEALACPELPALDYQNCTCTWRYINPIASIDSCIDENLHLMQFALAISTVFVTLFSFLIYLQLTRRMWKRIQRTNPTFVSNRNSTNRNTTNDDCGVAQLHEEHSLFQDPFSYRTRAANCYCEENCMVHYYQQEFTDRKASCPGCYIRGVFFTASMMGVVMNALTMGGVIFNVGGAASSVCAMLHIVLFLGAIALTIWYRVLPYILRFSCGTSSDLMNKSAQIIGRIDLLNFTGTHATGTSLTEHEDTADVFITDINFDALPPPRIFPHDTNNNSNSNNNNNNNITQSLVRRTNSNNNDDNNNSSSSIGMNELGGSVVVVSPRANAVPTTNYFDRRDSLGTNSNTASTSTTVSIAVPFPSSPASLPTRGAPQSVANSPSSTSSSRLQTPRKKDKRSTRSAQSSRAASPLQSSLYLQQPQPPLFSLAAMDSDLYQTNDTSTSTRRRTRNNSLSNLSTIQQQQQQQQQQQYGDDTLLDTHADANEDDEDEDDGYEDDIVSEGSDTIESQQQKRHSRNNRSGILQQQQQQQQQHNRSMNDVSESSDGSILVSDDPLASLRATPDSKPKGNTGNSSSSNSIGGGANQPTASNKRGRSLLFYDGTNDAVAHMPVMKPSPYRQTDVNSNNSNNNNSNNNNNNTNDVVVDGDDDLRITFDHENVSAMTTTTAAATNEMHKLSPTTRYFHSRSNNSSVDHDNIAYQHMIRSPVRRALNGTQYPQQPLSPITTPEDEFEIARVIREHLEDGEKILWWEKPRPRKLRVRSCNTLRLVLYSLVGLWSGITIGIGFYVFFVNAAISLFGMTILVGLLSASVCILKFAHLFLWSRVYYILTNQRAVICRRRTPVFGSAIAHNLVYSQNHIEDVCFAPLIDGSGSFSRRKKDSVFSFVVVSDIVAVERIVRHYCNLASSVQLTEELRRQHRQQQLDMEQQQ